MRYHVTTVLLALVFLHPAAYAAELEGYWEGAITNKGAECPLDMSFEPTGNEPAGTFSLPTYRWKDRPFASLTLQRGKLRALVTEKPLMVFEGEVKKDSIAGTFTVNAYTAPFHLKRADKPAAPYTCEEVTFANGDVSLAGVVYAPNPPGKHGAVVLLHGSGDNPRWDFNTPADWFARQGMVCLVFDKRGNGGSTGKWLDVGFNELADDGIAGLRMLQTRDDVDPKRIGFWGISQAGWIMEACAQRCPDTAYFISVSGGTAKVEREGYWDYECMMRAKGYGDADIAEAIEMLRRYNVTVRTGEGYQEFLEWMQPMRDKSWYALLEWAPRPPTAIFQQWYRRVMDFDPEPILRELDIPMLFIFGEADDSNPTAEGVAILNKVKAEAGKDITVHVFAGADHGVRVAPPDGHPFPFRIRPDGFWDETAAWLKAKGMN